MATVCLLLVVVSGQVWSGSVVAVVRVTALANAEYLIGSVALGIEEYYLGIGEAPGVWAGRWANELGLVGVVEADQLRALVEGRHPSSGDDLVKGLRGRSVRAFDVTFSAPKSVSMLWALGSPKAADAVMRAHVEAVDVAVRFSESRAAVARQQVDGVRRRVGTNGFVVAGFVHRTSREGDPQLHSHCLVPNLVRRASDGRVVALDGYPLHVWARAAGSVYQAELQRHLTRTLEVGWGEDRRNTRDLVGISVEQRRVFSKRSGQIEAELEAIGAAGLEDLGVRMRADDVASLATRVAKDRSLTPARLAEQWITEARAAGLPEGRHLEAAVRSSERRLGALSFEEVAGVLVDPEVGLCSRSARFSEADVVEHICAMSAGRLTVDDVEAYTKRFLGSELVVRLVPSTDDVVRRLPEWSTAAHRVLEDRVLGLLDHLGGRPAEAMPGTERALEAAGRLGEDQVAAVRVLCGPGGSVRCVLAPAGFGKTAMVHAAAAVVAQAGRPVVGVATTGKAVAELVGAGLPSTTIAHLRTVLADRPFAAGTVVVLDEVSQTSTRDAEAVLAAVAAAPGAQVWVLGDAKQGQPVLAGGLAHELAARAGAGAVPAATLTVNRRQTDPDDRRALTLLRSGKPTESQAARDEHGWEHQAGTPDATREAMADAVVADLDTQGPTAVVAMTVSHGDAEDLADRIRGHLITTGRIRGPVLTGPGWTYPREYQAGDRVLFHTRYGPRSGGLVNGTTGTVLEAGDRGLTVAIDGPNERRVVLPAEWLQGTRFDGSPNLSHAWARTVDGAQGGTWEAAHLLGTPALDAFRGYVGQSRSRQPTHTWNTTPVIDLDHGGRLADTRTPDEHVLAALARTPDARLAAVTDPHPADRRLRAQIAEHLDVLNSGPPERTRDLGRAWETLQKVERKQAEASLQLARAERERDDLGPLGVLRSHGRSERRRLDRDARTATDRVSQATAAVTAARDDVDRLSRAQADADALNAAEGWRRPEINRLREQLAEHWAVTIVSCARAGDPLAYGTDRLRHAAHHRHHTLRRLEASIPTDRSAELDRVTAALARTTAARDDAASGLAAARARLEQANSRHWPRPAEVPAATAGIERALDTLRKQIDKESNLRRRLDDVTAHEQRRRTALADTAPARGALLNDRSVLTRALDDTLVERVTVLATDPPEHLRSRLGPVPPSETGRAVWCHYAARIEADLDRDGTISAPSRYTINPRIVVSHAATAPDIERNDIRDAWDQVASTIRADALRIPEQQRVREVDHGVDISR